MTTATRVNNHGEVFTRRWVVDTILDLVGYTTDVELTAKSLTEPSCGSGAFLRPIVERLLASARRTRVDHADLVNCVRAFDLQVDHVESCRKVVAEALRLDGCDPDLADSLAAGWVSHTDYLLDENELQADFVVGNPPYVRIEDLDPEIAATYRARWSTMNGRADIYVPFIERSLSVLNPGGRMGFICADRWFRNSYGAALRKLVARDFAVEHVWTMHDVDAFADDVSAYPAITVIANEAQSKVTVLDTDHAFGEESAAEATRWARSRKPKTSGQGFTGHRLPHWFSGDGLWPTGSPARLALIEHLTDNFRPLDDPATGTKVGIGVATGADEIYCFKDPGLIEEDRALPMAAGRNLSSGTFVWGGEYLVNVWLPDGSLVDLVDYPKLAAYLETAGEQLRRRHTAKRNPTNWHRTIDKVSHKLLDEPLLMMRDLGMTANPVLVPAGYYPHHNIYWVSSTTWDLEVLGGLLLARTAQAFIEAFCVRMRGGTLRFQAQYLRQIRLPAPGSLTEEHMKQLRRAFLDRDADLATNTASSVLGIDPNDFEL